MDKPTSLSLEDESFLDELEAEEEKGRFKTPEDKKLQFDEEARDNDSDASSVSIESESEAEADAKEAFDEVVESEVDAALRPKTPSAVSPKQALLQSKITRKLSELYFDATVVSTGRVGADSSTITKGLKLMALAAESIPLLNPVAVGVKGMAMIAGKVDDRNGQNQSKAFLNLSGDTPTDTMGYSAFIKGVAAQLSEIYVGEVPGDLDSGAAKKGLRAVVDKVRSSNAESKIVKLADKLASAFFVSALSQGVQGLLSTNDSMMKGGVTDPEIRDSVSAMVVEQVQQISAKTSLFDKMFKKKSEDREAASKLEEDSKEVEDGVRIGGKLIKSRGAGFASSVVEQVMARREQERKAGGQER